MHVCLDDSFLSAQQWQWGWIWIHRQGSLKEQEIGAKWLAWGHQGIQWQRQGENSQTQSFELIVDRDNVLLETETSWKEPHWPHFKFELPNHSQNYIVFRDALSLFCFFFFFFNKNILHVWSIFGTCKELYGLFSLLTSLCLPLCALHKHSSCLRIQSHHFQHQPVTSQLWVVSQGQWENELSQWHADPSFFPFSGVFLIGEKLAFK